MLPTKMSIESKGNFIATVIRSAIALGRDFALVWECLDKRRGETYTNMGISRTDLEQHE